MKRRYPLLLSLVLLPAVFVTGCADQKSSPTSRATPWADNAEAEAPELDEDAREGFGEKKTDVGGRRTEATSAPQTEEDHNRRPATPASKVPRIMASAGPAGGLGAAPVDTPGYLGPGTGTGKGEGRATGGKGKYRGLGRKNKDGQFATAVDGKPNPPPPPGDVANKTRTGEPAVEVCSPKTA